MGKESATKVGCKPPNRHTRRPLAPPGYVDEMVSRLTRHVEQMAETTIEQKLGEILTGLEGRLRDLTQTLTSMRYHDERSICPTCVNHGKWYAAVDAARAVLDDVRKLKLKTELVAEEPGAS